jgi:UPF0271 protein
MIDLNCDMGEYADEAGAHREEELMQYITRANIACGGHAGDERSIRDTIRLALRLGVEIGGHPGYPDRDNFGRVSLHSNPEQIMNMMHPQIFRFWEVSGDLQCRVSSMKAHGALYSDISTSRDHAAMYAFPIACMFPEAVLILSAGTLAYDYWSELKVRVMAEGFADRRYEADGSLRSRKYPDALITDPAEAVDQVWSILFDHRAKAIGGNWVGVKAETICLHSDTPNAVEIARKIRESFHGIDPTKDPS